MCAKQTHKTRCDILNSSVSAVVAVFSWTISWFPSSLQTLHITTP